MVAYTNGILRTVFASLDIFSRLIVGSPSHSLSKELSNERLSALMEDLQVIHRYAVLSLFVLEKCKVVTLKYLFFETWNLRKCSKSHKVY